MISPGARQSAPASNAPALRSTRARPPYRPQRGDPHAARGAPRGSPLARAATLLLNHRGSRAVTQSTQGRGRCARRPRSREINTRTPDRPTPKIEGRLRRTLPEQPARTTSKGPARAGTTRMAASFFPRPPYCRSRRTNPLAHHSARGFSTPRTAVFHFGFFQREPFQPVLVANTNTSLKELSGARAARDGDVPGRPAALTAAS